MQDSEIIEGRAISRARARNGSRVLELRRVHALGAEAGEAVSVECIFWSWRL